MTPGEKFAAVIALAVGWTGGMTGILLLQVVGLVLGILTLTAAAVRMAQR